MTNWYVIDLANKRLGRVASLVAKLLIVKPLSAHGKRACVYKLILINLNKLLVSQRALKKCYWHHTGYPGGLKQKLASQFSKSDLFIKTLTKMLPKTRTRRALVSNLRLFGDSNISSLGKYALYLSV
ncbi:MAG: uL13 family ribosomal protein [Candidatus Hodgkinia cicadicola]